MLYIVDDGRTKPEPRKAPVTRKTAARKRTTSSAADHHHESDEHQCLIRATKGNKKISTVVRMSQISSGLVRGTLIQHAVIIWLYRMSGIDQPYKRQGVC